MPHVSSGGSEDFFSKDEVKVYKDEGEEEKRSSENLSEDKLGLVTESEEGKNPSLTGQSYPGNEKSASGRSEDDKVVSQHPADRGIGPIPGYVVSPYPYPNGASVPASLHSASLGEKLDEAPKELNNDYGGKMSMVQPPLASLMMYNNDYSQPPPAHMGIPPVHIDPKTDFWFCKQPWAGEPGRVHPSAGLLLEQGLPRPPMYGYPAPPGQFPHPIYGPDFPQVQWQRPPGYPISSSTFSGPYPPSLINTSTLSRFGPPSLLPPPGLPHPGIPHPAIVTTGPKQEVMSHSQDNHRDAIFPELARNPEFYEFWRKSASDYGHSLPEQSSSHASESQTSEKKKQHIKKPLNAFMLFMKEMRPKVVAECTLKESAAINQILGRKWHALDRSEQAKYYEMARKEKELHMQLYPGWSARDNYASHTKKKKRKREAAGENKAKSRLPWYFNDVNTDSITAEGSSGGDSYHWERSRPSIIECSNPKKCRARFGLDQQNQWCKPCRRKKKCIRFLTGEDGTASNTDGEDGNEDVMSDGIATTTTNTTADSIDESDCNLESPNLSPHSEDLKDEPKVAQSIKMESTDSPPLVPRTSSSPNT